MFTRTLFVSCPSEKGSGVGNLAAGRFLSHLGVTIIGISGQPAGCRACVRPWLTRNRAQAATCPVYA